MGARGVPTQTHKVTVVIAAVVLMVTVDRGILTHNVLTIFNEVLLV